jgi:hypothetical protein
MKHIKPFFRGLFILIFLFAGLVIISSAFQFLNKTATANPPYIAPIQCTTIQGLSERERHLWCIMPGYGGCAFSYINHVACLPEKD